MTAFHHWRAMAPLTGWAIVRSGTRSAWSAFQFLGRTRDEARENWMESYHPKRATSEQRFREGMANGDLRFARVTVQEVGPDGALRAIGGQT